jgi:hypothetical protein
MLFQGVEAGYRSSLLSVRRGSAFAAALCWVITSYAVAVPTGW